MADVDSFVDDVTSTLPLRDLQDIAATQVLLATRTWPQKFAGWRDSPYVIDEPEWTGFDFFAIRDAVNSDADGPWCGCSSGELRVLMLACLIARGGALSDNLDGVDAKYLIAARSAIVALIDRDLAHIEQGKAILDRFPNAMEEFTRDDED